MWGLGRCCFSTGKCSLSVAAPVHYAYLPFLSVSLRQCFGSNSRSRLSEVQLQNNSFFIHFLWNMLLPPPPGALCPCVCRRLRRGQFCVLARWRWCSGYERSSSWRGCGRGCSGGGEEGGEEGGGEGGV